MQLQPLPRVFFGTSSGQACRASLLKRANRKVWGACPRRSALFLPPWCKAAQPTYDRSVLDEGVVRVRVLAGVFLQYQSSCSPISRGTASRAQPVGVQIPPRAPSQTGPEGKEWQEPQRPCAREREAVEPDGFGIGSSSDFWMITSAPAE